MATESPSSHGEGALCTRLHHHPVFVGFVQDAPGPAWWSKPAEVGFPLLPSSPSAHIPSFLFFSALDKMLKFFENSWKGNNTQE